MSKRAVLVSTLNMSLVLNLAQMRQNKNDTVLTLTLLPYWEMLKLLHNNCQLWEEGRREGVFTSSHFFSSIPYSTYDVITQHYYITTQDVNTQSRSEYCRIFTTSFSLNKWIICIDCVSVWINLRIIRSHYRNGFNSVFSSHCKVHSFHALFKYYSRNIPSWGISIMCLMWIKI